MKFGTKVLHAGIAPDPSTGAIMTPIFQTSTYVQESPGKHKGFEYARTQNPTRTVLEENLAALENAKYGRCFSSGMGATDAVIKLLAPGDEVICTHDLYGGTYRLFTTIYQSYGIVFKFVDLQDVEAVKKAFNPKTKMIWIESPTNPMMRIVDISAMVNIAKPYNSWVCVDLIYKIRLT
jgi:cystathionine gamma-lyase